MTQRLFDELLGPRPVMVILRGHGPDRTVELSRRAWTSGVPLVEVPVQDESDWDALAAAVAAGREQGKVVGAGTVVGPELVERAAGLGAAFTVAPGFDREVLAASVAAGLAHLPGVATASEVHHAMRSGLRWLKAFPASVLGPGWFGAMRGPFPGARFVATGGVDLDNAPAMFAAGAAAVCLGSSFSAADPARVEELVHRS